MEFMECIEHSNFSAMCNKIRVQEAEELRLALKAYGGEFIWIDDEEELNNPPIVMVNLNEGPMDAVIHKAWLDENECIELLAFDNEWGEQIDIDLEDISPGHLSFLISHMPVTDEVKSVAISNISSNK